MAMNCAVFWFVTPCSSDTAWRFGRTYRLHLQGRNVRLSPNYTESQPITPYVSLRKILTHFSINRKKKTSQKIQHNELSLLNLTASSFLC
jgi:hypothetical protein